MPTRNTPNEEKALIAEQFYAQVSESIKLVFDLTSRIDERVKMLVERQNALDEKLDKITDIQQDNLRRVIILEESKMPAIKELAELKIEHDHLKDKVHGMEIELKTVIHKTETHGTRMNQIFDWVLKLLFILLGGYLLYKFGWQAPPTP